MWCSDIYTWKNSVFEHQLAQTIDKRKLKITQEGRECLTTEASHSQTHKHEGVPATATKLKSCRLWQCVARQLWTGILKDLHPATLTSDSNHTKHMATSQKNCSFRNITVLTLNLPLLLHNRPRSQTQLTPTFKMEEISKHS